MNCECCGTSRGVTYHPKINMTLCKDCADLVIVALSTMDENRGVASKRQILAATRNWYRFMLKEA